MSKHTPGPWRIGMKPGPMIYGSDSSQVADLRADFLDKDELSANARLIAAAPEMLDLLYSALPCVEESEEFNKPRMPKDSLKIRALIKQIEGE